MTREFICLANLEADLLKELDIILEQEELLWRQKSRVSWLKAGERNTCFFHASTIIRRPRNRIWRLHDSNGVWCEDEQQLRNMENNFYRNLYTSESVMSCNTLDWTFAEVNHQDKRWLNRQVSHQEIKAAIFQMASNKAPEPNGYTLTFF